MTGCIDKRDFLIVVIHLIGCNVLSNTTSLSLCHSRITNSIKQRCLSMIDVSHNGYYRWAFLKIRLIVVFVHGKARTNGSFLLVLALCELDAVIIFLLIIIKFILVKFIAFFVVLVFVIFFLNVIYSNNKPSEPLCYSNTRLRIQTLCHGCHNSKFCHEELNDTNWFLVEMISQLSHRHCRSWKINTLSCECSFFLGCSASSVVTTFERTTTHIIHGLTSLTSRCKHWLWTIRIST
mmetsp:Transcript_51829/g.77379  ORF Transcript_51829/g.77379 Transcript_51829/m.77379 type:complete len:236 (+) Transcript_51829:1095-1802(+)